MFLFADTAINIDPDAKTLAEMALLGAEAAENLFEMTPRIALLSFSNFGNVKNHPQPRKVAQALDLVRAQRPNLIIDASGEYPNL